MKPFDTYSQINMTWKLRSMVLKKSQQVDLLLDHSHLITTSCIINNLSKKNMSHESETIGNV